MHNIELCTCTCISCTGMHTCTCTCIYVCEIQLSDGSFLETMSACNRLVVVPKVYFLLSLLQFNIFELLDKAGHCVSRPGSRQSDQFW